MKKGLVLVIVFIQVMTCVAQSVIHYVSNSGDVVEPLSNSFCDADGTGLTVTSNTYSDGLGTIILSGDAVEYVNGALFEMDLLYVTVPATVKKIGSNAFSSCTHLQAVLFESSSVPAVSDDDSYTFSNNNITVYAPIDSYGIYRDAFISNTSVQYVCVWQDVTLNSGGMGTFSDTSGKWLYYSEFCRNSGLKAYRCSECTENTITFTETMSSLNGYGVVLVGEPGKTYRLLETKTNLEAVTNYMIAADGNIIDDTKGKYILTNGTKGIGFYPIQAGTAVAKGKAYLDVGSDSEAKFLTIELENTPSSIEMLSQKLCSKTESDTMTDVHGSMINLSGCRVGDDYRGIVIINGRKHYRK